MTAPLASEAVLGPLAQIAHPVADVERSVAFFRDLLGLPLLFRAPPGLAFFDCGGVRLMLDSPAYTHGHRQASFLYFRVGDMTEAVSVLEARGLRFETPAHRVARLPDHDLWMAFFRDPDQHVLAPACEVRPPAAI